MKVTRPVLRYHGGKFRLAWWIVSHFPPHRAYVEPYGGAASVLLRKPRAPNELYNDLDGDVVNVFRVLRDPETAEALRRACELTPFARLEFDLSYEPTDDPVEQARRTIVRGFSAHGSSSRRKQRSGFRSGMCHRSQSAAVDWRNWPDAVPAFVDRLRGVTIEHRDALEVIRKHDADNTLFYVDPPYPLSTRSSIRGPCEVSRAYTHEMTDDQHEALAACLWICQGAVILSGYRCDLYDGLYPDWHRAERDVLADSGARRTEVLWINERALKAQPLLWSEP